MKSGLLIAAVVAAAGVLWWIALSGINDPSVTRYCAYGAVSEAQLDGCNSHVTADQINALDTNAARYAKATLSECLADSGLAGQTGLFHTSLPRS
jgi:hypothetical protein